MQPTTHHWRRNSLFRTTIGVRHLVMHGERALLVEDDDLLSRSVVRELESRGALVSVAGTVAEGLSLLGMNPALVLTDVYLPDGSGIQIVRAAAALCPKPRIIALSGRASAEEGFQLHAQGATAYLTKPITRTTLNDAIDRVLAGTNSLAPVAADLVGQVEFEKAHDELKRTMIQQALGLKQNNITHAAQLLGVSRQRLQQWMRVLEPDKKFS